MSSCRKSSPVLTSPNALDASI
jgi:hypothetical protein